MKKNYTAPHLEVLVLGRRDVVTTSSIDGGEDGGPGIGESRHRGAADWSDDED